MPILCFLSQQGGVEGLGLGAQAMGMMSPDFDDSLISVLSTRAVALLFMLLILGVPYGCLCMFQHGLSSLGRMSRTWRVRQERPHTSMGVQADFGMSMAERRFSQEYVDRSTYHNTLCTVTNAVNLRDANLF